MTDLGTTTKDASTPVIIEVEKHDNQHKFALLTSAQNILDGDNHRICMCCKSAIPDQDIQIKANQDKTRAGWAGLMKCGNVWGCPVCSSKISEERREELAQAVAVAKNRGWTVVMMTNTVSHHKGQSAREVLLFFRKCWAKFTGGRFREQFYEDWRIQGSVRALETTYGENGWHIHTHTLLFLDLGDEWQLKSEDQPEDSDETLYDDLFPTDGVHKMEQEARRRWIQVVESYGGKANKQGLVITKHDGKLDEYIAKYGKLPDPSKTQIDEWDEAAELTKAVTKKGKVEGGRTPFQLLADAHDGDKRSAYLFREYVLAMYKQPQLVWSKGLKADLLADVDELTDQEIANQEETEVVATLERETYREVVNQKMRGKLLDMVVNGQLDEIGRASCKERV